MAFLDELKRSSLASKAKEISDELDRLGVNTREKLDDLPVISSGKVAGVASNIVVSAILTAPARTVAPAERKPKRLTEATGQLSDLVITKKVEED